MITRIEALNYRCLRYVRQDLGPFHVLVGPNASGKTTFLDVVAFLGRLVTDGPEAAVVERSENFEGSSSGAAGVTASDWPLNWRFPKTAVPSWTSNNLGSYAMKSRLV